MKEVTRFRLGGGNKEQKHIKEEIYTMDEKTFDFAKPTEPHTDGIMRITHREHHRPNSDSTTDVDAATLATVSSAYAERGAPINRSMTAELKKEANSALTWSRIRRTFREPLSEFMGVFILIMVRSNG